MSNDLLFYILRVIVVTPPPRAPRRAPFFPFHSLSLSLSLPLLLSLDSLFLISGSFSFSFFLDYFISLYFIFVLSNLLLLR
jgi:hypothetical protein